MKCVAGVRPEPVGFIFEVKPEGLASPRFEANLKPISGAGFTSVNVSKTLLQYVFSFWLHWLHPASPGFT